MEYKIMKKAIGKNHKLLWATIAKEISEQKSFHKELSAIKDKVFQQLFPDQIDIAFNCFACHQAKAKPAREHDYCSLCPIGDCQPEYFRCEYLLYAGDFAGAAIMALIIKNKEWKNN